MTVRDSAARRASCHERLCAQKWEFPLCNMLGATRPKEGIPMTSILGPVRFSVKEKLGKHLRRCRSAGVRIRYLIIINLLNGRSARRTAEVLHVHNTTVYRVAKRFRQHGEWALWDAREDNGITKLDEHFLTTLYRVVRAIPQRYGWRRPTWTRELLVETLVRQTGTRARDDDESGPGYGPGTAGTTAADGWLPVGQIRENTSFERDPHAGGNTAAWPHRGLRGRGRYPS
jgi:transposase